MSESVVGLRVVVTGATKGIGKGIAMKFANAGCKVLFVGRCEEDGNEIVKSLQSLGCIAFFLKADVSLRVDCEIMASTAVNLMGGIDVIVANAGIYPQKMLSEIDDVDYDSVLGTNLKGAIMCVQACETSLIQSGCGRVILISSITGAITGMSGYSLYGASKAAMLGFMRSVALEFAPKAVTVNAILPGNILTEGLSAIGEEYISTMSASVPVGRLGSVDDIAHAALFLASRHSGFITGQTIVVDGGQVLPEANG